MGTFLKNHFTSFVMMTIMVAGSLFFTGCGRNKQFIESIRLQTSTVDQDHYLSVEAQFKSGALRLPAMRLPVVDPRNPKYAVGSFELKSQSKRTSSLLKLNLNISEMSQVSTTSSSLPNNTEIPFVESKKVTVAAFPVAQTKAKVFLALDQGVAVIGASLPIRELDHLGKWTGFMNLFYPFTRENVNATAGIFTGPNVGQNGFGFFVDAGPALLKVLPDVVGPISSSLSVGSQVGNEAMPLQSRVVFQEQGTKTTEEKRIHDYLLQLNLSQSQLHLE